MVTILVPLAVAVVGLIAWFGATNPKVQKAGEWCFVIGAFWTVHAVSGNVLHLP